jgi:hypothetical protein
VPAVMLIPGSTSAIAAGARVRRFMHRHHTIKDNSELVASFIPARVRLHGDGSVALTPAVQYIGGVGGVGIGVTPCVISWVWYSGHVTSGGMFI